ncbi:hypothetical protein BRETT_004721 [Brettanomyces bruxellensis]|uniref:AP-1 complex subunit gamma n=1 Tax=Dekkera bruxellensis TaxID=5007 RepID=A0A871R1A5_DEKBR|nr:uncharacterized protein BRETT_004721 [Brettanomyces bruxellensis]QOU20073.1 hypothetical protein BRETT_004721 [Brettanomyces bruxellensis]
MGSLRSFIRAVRSSRTIADERAVIRKESAKVRTAFRDPHLDEPHLRKNIEKLLYLYILGEPTSFGQVECLKLLTSRSYINKRLGYLAAMLILDENQEILTLLTNSLDIDIKSTNPYVAGLALCTLGNIASPELAKDLYADVDRMLDNDPNHSSNISTPYLRKKATIVAAKLIDKDPDLSELFIGRIPMLLREKSHGVLLGALHLVRETFIHDPTSREILRKQAPVILSHLRFLVSTGYSPEYDVRSVPDPFLYCSLLQTLRCLLDKDDNNPNLEALNDLLAQVCARLENSKGPGYAVLYEAVQTIFAINSDSSLKVLGINILSKFLSLKDNNTRYVALNTLLSVIEYEPLAVQRHRNIVVGCLQDGDISIRRRALELTFAIMNNQNIRMLTKELLKFLGRSEEDNDLKSYITTQFTLACYKYSPGLEWTFHTLIQLLEKAGDYFSDDILSSILALTMQNEDKELTKKLVIHLIAASSSPDAASEFGLSLITIWCLGEYGDLVVGVPNYKSEKLITEKQEVDQLELLLNASILKKSSRRDQIRLYILTASLKLSSRFKSAKQIEHLRQMINKFKNDTNLEIQIRAIEYTEIFTETKTIKRGLLERMPPPPRKEHQGIALFDREAGREKTSSGESDQKKDTGEMLLDLLDDEDNVDDQKAEESTSGNAEISESKNGALDILNDIFGDTGMSHNAQQPAKKQSTSNKDILDLFGSVGGASTTKKTEAVDKISIPETAITAYDDGNIYCGVDVESIGDGKANLDIIVKNISSASTINGITVLCAVTKKQKLDLSALTQRELAPKKLGKLKAKILGPSGSKVKLRVRLSYNVGGEKIQRQFDFAGIQQRL